MQIVTDTGMDMYLPKDLMPGIDIHIVRHKITLGGKEYHSGLDIQAEELQQKLLVNRSWLLIPDRVW